MVVVQGRRRNLFASTKAPEITIEKSGKMIEMNVDYDMPMHMIHRGPERSMPETQVHANILPEDADGDVVADYETPDHSLLDAEV